MEVSSVAKVEEFEKEKGEQVEVEDVDEIELSLELSIGRKIYTKSNPLHNKSMDSSPSCPKIGGLDFTEDAQISVLPRSVVAHIDPATDQQSKREIQAMRRQEARKKREEKLKIKTIPRGKKGNFCSVNGDKERRENHEEEEDDIVVLDKEEAEPPRKKEKNEKMVQNHKAEDLVVKDLSLTLNNNRSNSMGQMQYPYRPALQYVPFTNGFVYPYGVVPCWGPVAAGNGSGTGGNEGQEKEKRVNLGNNGGTEGAEKEKKVSFEPVACRSFRPYNRNSEQNRNGKLDGSSGGSSSAVSDYQNSSLQGD